MDDINREKLMGAEREKSIRWREKGAKQDCRLEEQMIGGGGGGQRRRTITKRRKHFGGRHKAIRALTVFLIKII